MNPFATRLSPTDPHLEQRVARLRELGLDQGDALVSIADPIADDLGRRFGSDLAIVNLLGHEQTFVGLAVLGWKMPDPGRTMALTDGYCPAVVRHGLPRAYSDVLAAARTALSAPVTAFNIRSYVGVPLMDTHTGLALGTICVLHRRPREQDEVDATVAYLSERAPTVLPALTERRPT